MERPTLFLYSLQESLALALKELCLWLLLWVSHQETTHRGQRGAAAELKIRTKLTPCSLSLFLETTEWCKKWVVRLQNGTRLLLAPSMPHSNDALTTGRTKGAQSGAFRAVSPVSDLWLIRNAVKVPSSPNPHCSRRSSRRLSRVKPIWPTATLALYLHYCAVHLRSRLTRLLLHWNQSQIYRFFFFFFSRDAYSKWAVSNFHRSIWQKGGKKHTSTSNISIKKWIDW